MSVPVSRDRLGTVTAYSYAVAGGYTGTEAEFQELLTNVAIDLSEIENLSVIVTPLSEGSTPTASYDSGVLTLGIPKGDTGDSGVYIGETAPTNPNVDVWINPNGEGIEMVQDVIAVNKSVVTNGIATIPMVKNSSNDFGLVKVAPDLGIASNGGFLATVKSPTSYIKSGTDQYLSIVPVNQHESTFYGLAKASGDTTQSQSNNSVGTYTDEAKASIQSMLGVPSEDDVISDVQVNGTSVVVDGVANVPIAGGNRLGAVLIKNADLYGLTIDSDGNLRTYPPTINNYKVGTATYKPVCVENQHASTFYGLAKAAGHDEKDSTLALGTYTDEAKAAIQTMLDVPSNADVVNDVQIDGTSIVSDGVANVPIASASAFGVVKTSSMYGIQTLSNGSLDIVNATGSEIKAGENANKPIVPEHQHQSVFYGLAKAASDTTQASSSNSVGTYTPEAKIAIKQMLGVNDSYDCFIETISGTDPVIVGEPSYRYNCGTVNTLTITPPSSGTIDVIFSSGSTPTVLTLPQTVRMPDWWVDVEANTTYEMCITDGVYCGVMSWAD